MGCETQMTATVKRTYNNDWYVTCREVQMQLTPWRRTRRFITVVTRSLHRSIFRVNRIYSTPPTQPISLRSILIASPYLRFGLTSGLFPSGLPIEYKIWSSSLCNFLHSPVTSSLLGPNILLRTLFPNTLRLCSFLNARDQVRHPYITTDRIVAFGYIRIFNFRKILMETKK
jgi:hypothetical protein